MKVMMLSLVLSMSVCASSYAQDKSGKWFTVVVLSDPHVATSGHDGTSVADMQTYVQQIVRMGRDGGMVFRFDSLPDYVLTADLVLCLGDMDQDSKSSMPEFNEAVAGFKTAGIPFVTMCGNHDLVPDYWTGTNPDQGLTGGSGGYLCNEVALQTVSDYLWTAADGNVFANPITDVVRFNDGSDHVQAEPFCFLFNGVRFYCGQTYWFQKPWGKFTKTFGYYWGDAHYYAPDGVIDALETFVNQHQDEPSFWCQHYSFVAGSDNSRWWLDQNDTGMSIAPEDATAYTTVAQKKQKLASIINKTKNPVHFSGHTHDYSVNTFSAGGKKFTDYTVCATGRDNNGLGGTYIVLMNSERGVVEVKQAHFTADAVCRSFSADAPTMSVGESIYQEFEAQSERRYEITDQLGTNWDFETAQMAAPDGLPNVHAQTGWTVRVTEHSTEGNVQYVKLEQRTDDKANTPTSLYLRAKWMMNPALCQVERKVELPAGKYVVSFRWKQSLTSATNLCYYEVGGKRTLLTGSATWATKSINVNLTEASTLTLSFGFRGGQGSQESYVSLDDVHIYLAGLPASVGIEATTSIPSSRKRDSCGTYDLQGRKITTPLPRHLYIRSGKKVVM